MIVTLAGHVDHGKTALVQALTGVNTDRLAEEKRRGLTIDLGFAYLKEGGVNLGFVDVPGHHRFIHNMVAGVSAHQHALLVVAADDGPMPQSREHLQILDLIGIESGVVALSKCDRVSPERRRAAAGEVRALLEGSPLAGAPIIETSVTTGEGVQHLKAHLLEASGNRAAADPGGTLRMPIDRAFTISGAGVVVTGTIHSGRVRVDDTLTLFPSGTEVRVKGIRAQDTAAEQALAGERAAVNLSGVEIDAVRRGQWLTREADPGSREFSLALRVLEDFPRPLRHWLPVHAYHATSHSTGRLALLSQGRLAPGESALVELVTDEPLLLRRGDPLVIRDQGLDRTLGGGRVVSIQPPEGRRRSPARIRRLSADALTDPAASLGAHLSMGAVDLNRFRRNWGLDDARLESLLRKVACRTVDGFAVRKADWESWRAAVLEEIQARHRADASLQGLKQSELRAPVEARFLQPILNTLASDGALTAQAGRYRPTQHHVALSVQEQEWLRRVTPLLNRPQPPSLGDMAKQFRLGVGDLARRLHPLVAKNHLVRISDTRYYLPDHLKELAGLARALGKNGPFTVRQYRDAAGIGRNVAIEVLEHFDRSGFTRRDADVRTIIGEWKT